MDKKIRELEETLLNTINSYELPLEVKKLCLESLYLKVERETNKVIEQQELAEIQAELDADNGEEEQNNA